MKSHRVGRGKISMMGQIESDEIFVSELKAKERMITGSSVLLFLFQWEYKKCLSYHHRCANFWHINKNFE